MLLRRWWTSAPAWKPMRSLAALEVSKLDKIVPSTPVNLAKVSSSTRLCLPTSLLATASLMACIRVCRSVSQSVSPSVRPSVRQSVSPSVRQSVSPSVRQSVSPSVRQSVSPSVSQPACLPACLSLSASLLACLSLSASLLACLSMCNSADCANASSEQTEMNGYRSGYTAHGSHRVRAKRRTERDLRWHLTLESIFV